MVSKKPRSKVFRKRSAKKGATKSGNLVRLIKRVVAGKQETKVATYNNTVGVNDYIINHNLSTRITQNVLFTLQGATDATPGFSNRIGDEINPIGVKFYFQFKQYPDRPNVTWRVWFVKVKGGQSMVSSTVLIRAVTGNLMMDPIDTERCSLIKQWTFKAPDNYWQGTAGTSKDMNFFRSAYVKLPSTSYKYGADNSGYSNMCNYPIYVSAYDSTGSLITDQLGVFNYSHEFFFKDG